MTPRTLRNWIYLGLLSITAMAMACQCFGAAPTVSLYVHTPSSLMEPLSVWSAVDFGRRMMPIASNKYGWTNTTGSIYSMDVGLSTLSLTGSGTPLNVEVKEGISLSDAFLTEGSGTTTLNSGEWFLSGDTLYVRLSDDTNPQSQTDGHELRVSYDVGTTGDSEGPQDCTIDWWLTGDTGSIPVRYYQVTDQRDLLSGRTTDVRGSTGGTGNGPHGMAFSWCGLPAGTYHESCSLMFSGDAVTTYELDTYPTDNQVKFLQDRVE